MKLLRLVLLAIAVCLSSTALLRAGLIYGVSGWGSISFDGSPSGGEFTDINFQGEGPNGLFFVSDYGWMTAGGYNGATLISGGLGDPGTLDFSDGETLEISGVETIGPKQISYMGPWLEWDETVTVSPTTSQQSPSSIPEPVPGCLTGIGLMAVLLNHARHTWHPRQAQGSKPWHLNINNGAF